MFHTLDISIISTEKDFDLFTNKGGYFFKVKKIVDKWKEEYSLTKDHAIACHDDCIKLYKGRELCAIGVLD